MVVSNCGAVNNRLAYVSEMIGHGVKLDSFGACLHNKDFPPDAKAQSIPWKIKITTLEKCVQSTTSDC